MTEIDNDLTSPTAEAQADDAGPGASPNIVYFSRGRGADGDGGSTGADGPGVERDEQVDAVWSRFASGPMPQLPKMAAVNRLFKAAVDSGLPEGFADVLAHAAVDPAAARSAINSPTRLNVPGGVIELVDLDLWTPGVVPMPTNNRTMDQRVYPAAGVAGYQGPLSGPRSEAGETSTLVVGAASPEHMVEQATRAGRYVLDKNPLAESIAVRGIVMQTDVVYVEVEHADGEEPLPVLATAEGSSRDTNAHHVLGLDDPQVLHYDFSADRDMFRRFINNIVAADPTDPELKARDREQLLRRRNALIMPARVFLRFIPSGADVGAYTYARAVNAYLGMLHVDPPKPWSTTGKAEAMADSVLITLHDTGLISDVEKSYLAGLMSPEDAAVAGYPTEPDEQAAYVLSALLRGGRKASVERGIKDVTAKRSVSAGRRVDVVAELALRPTRGAAVARPPGPEKDRSERMRAGFMRGARLPGFATRWSVTSRTPQALLEAALREHQVKSREWASRLELAALGLYHLSQWQVLRREAMGGGPDADKRGPQDLLKKMLEDPMGLHLLARAVDDGRAGRPPRVVDAAGAVVHGHFEGDELVEDPDEGPVEATDEWLRYEAYPEASAPRRKRIKPGQESAHSKLGRLRGEARTLVEELAGVIAAINEVVGEDGRPMIMNEGWVADELIATLGSAQGQLHFWSYAAKGASPSADDEDTDDDLDDTDIEDTDVGEEDADDDAGAETDEDGQLDD